LFSPDLDGPERALDTIKDQVCLALTLMDQRGPWTQPGKRQSYTGPYNEMLEQRPLNPLGIQWTKLKA
jgi:hypothetical protein